MCAQWVLFLLRTYKSLDLDLSSDLKLQFRMAIVAVQFI